MQTYFELDSNITGSLQAIRDKYVKFGEKMKGTKGCHQSSYSHNIIFFICVISVEGTPVPPLFTVMGDFAISPGFCGEDHWLLALTLSIHIFISTNCIEWMTKYI